MGTSPSGLYCRRRLTSMSLCREVLLAFRRKADQDGWPNNRRRALFQLRQVELRDVASRFQASLNEDATLTRHAFADMLGQAAWNRLVGLWRLAENYCNRVAWQHGYRLVTGADLLPDTFAILQKRLAADQMAEAFRVRSCLSWAAQYTCANQVRNLGLRRRKVRNVDPASYTLTTTPARDEEGWHEWVHRKTGELRSMVDQLVADKSLDPAERTILEMTWDGQPAASIAKAIGKPSLNAFYAARCRLLGRLRLAFGL
jgi:hypothetical protein